MGDQERQGQNGGAGAVEGTPVGLNETEPVLTISDTAKERIRTVLQSQEPPVEAIRISSPARGKYAMNLEPEGRPALDDVVLGFEGFQVYVDPESLPRVRGATVDWVDTFGGGGFQFTNPNDQAGPVRKEPPPGPEGEVWRQIQQVLDEEINPAVAGHGGFISLIDVQDGTVYVQMGGGCQGCGMANVTLKQGVERILQDRIPEVREILDVTDHAEGRNPYYAPSSK